MTMANPTDPILQKKLENLQRDLITIHQKIGQIEPLAKQFQTLQSNLHDLKTYMESNPAQAEQFQKQLQEKQIFQWLGNLRLSANQTNQALAEFNQDISIQTIFLDNNRTYRNYSFPTSQDMLGFLEEAGFIYDFREYVFKPNYIGMIDYGPLEQNLALIKISNDTWRTTPEQLKRVVLYLYEKKVAITFKLESNAIRILVKNSQNLKVEAQNPIIRRLDLLAKNKNGSPLND